MRHKSLPKTGLCLFEQRTKGIAPINIYRAGDNNRLSWCGKLHAITEGDRRHVQTAREMMAFLVKSPTEW